MGERHGGELERPLIEDHINLFVDEVVAAPVDVAARATGEVSLVLTREAHTIIHGGLAGGGRGSICHRCHR